MKKLYASLAQFISINDLADKAPIEPVLIPISDQTQDITNTL
ncbi:hypothetical protein [Thalassotalea piscium]|uniref:Uncharacterized protein n=1 Tax=Thalassotalea piscium TaxID=1230533 RepID=A0A7X0TTA1_9GAMM|nr:hypothetical protein [Thalassotalea piscium]MBB6542880.1 hypothetical protein [Thalassotalea piscium]